MQELMGDDEFLDNDMGADDEDISDEAPNKKTAGDLLQPPQNDINFQQKWEKNVRRRVYDALNVLYAAGRLKKEGKYVSCDPHYL
jgi:hypothetical protein